MEPIRPYVTLHFAQTMDGRIATRTGHSRWVSCNESLLLAHELRAQNSALLIGIGTVLADNPLLTVRHAVGPSPMRCVVDSSLRLPLDSRIVLDRSAPTLVATTPNASATKMERLKESGVQVVVCDATECGQVDLRGLLHVLAARSRTSLLIEGGSKLITSALRLGIVDRCVVCIAPKLVGCGVDAVGDLQVGRMDDALHFTSGHFTGVGQDIIFDGQLARESVPSA